MDFPEMMFYAEAEGLIPTRLGKINAAVTDIKADSRPEISLNDLSRILKNHGLNFHDLTTGEINYITNAIA